MPVEDAEGFAADAAANAAPLLHPHAADRALHEEAIVPHAQDFATVGHLYRAIDVGFAWLCARLGEKDLFVGPPEAQATHHTFRWPQLVPVTGLESAHTAIDTIIEQGEGALGNWRTAHFGRFLEVFQEYMAMRRADPGFEPARPVLVGTVRHDVVTDMPVISDPTSARIVDLFDVANEIVLMALTRCFAGTDETELQRKTLADVAVGLMFTATKALGERLTALPFGPDHPDATAAPSFRLEPQGVALLPHRRAAWLILQERLREAAEYGRRIDASPSLGLGRVSDAFERYAARLAESSGPD
jgi:hypothetical protein